MSLKVNLWRKEYMEYVALKDVCKINMGQSPDSSSYNDKKEGIPFYQGNADFGEKHPIPRVWCNAPTKIAQPKDILMSVRAPIGALNYAQEKCCIGRGLAAITPDKDKLSLEFLYWFLRGKNSELNSKGTGSTFKAISKKTLEEIRVPLIDLEKQQKMAQALEKTYSVIQMRTKQSKELDDLIKARFVEMFGDAYSNPRGLPVLEWNDVFNTTTGKLDSNAATENGAYPFFTCSKEALRIDKYAFDQEALLLAGNNAAGKYDVKHYNGKFNAYQRTYVLSLKQEWSYALFKYQLEDKLVYLQQQSLGGLTKYLTMKILGDLTFLLPSMDEQKQFEDFVAQIDKSKATVQKALDETQLLFDSLMQQYFG